MAHLPSFTPVPSRHRVDGWTAERQVAFIEALATTANVAAAAKAVGMSTSSAYELRARHEAASFREAWRLALDYAVHRLGEAALDRALNGTATPVFFQGEQIGERRRYDERLTMFILGLRDPERYGAWRHGMRPWHGADAAAALLHLGVLRTAIDGDAAAESAPPPPRPSLPDLRMLSDREVEALEAALAQRLVDRHRAAEAAREQARWEAQDPLDLDDDGGT